MKPECIAKGDRDKNTSLSKSTIWPHEYENLDLCKSNSRENPSNHPYFRMPQ